MRGADCVALWVRSQLRRQIAALAFVAVTVALVGALVMTAAVGARRAGTAWDRLLARSAWFDLLAELPVDQVPAAVTVLGARPDVADVAAFTYMAVTPAGDERFAQSGAFAALTPSFGTTVYRPRILSGRAADQARPDEVTINPSMAALGLRVGDRIELGSDPDVVHQEATIVGVHVGPFDLGTNAAQPHGLLTAAFAERWWTPYVEALRAAEGDVPNPALAARVVRDGDPAAVEAAISERFPDAVFPSPDDEVGQEVVQALDAQRNAFWLLTAATALGGLVVVGVGVGRSVRRQAGELHAMAALGATPKLRHLLVTSPAALAAALGVLTAPVISVVASRSVPTGLARRVEPNPGTVVDWTVLLVGSALTLVVALSLAWFAALRSDRRSRDRLVALRPLPRIVRQPSALFGARAASGWGSRAGRATSRAVPIAAAAACFAVAGALTWSVNANHLLTTPDHYGWTWDVGLGSIDESAAIGDGSAALDASAQRASEQPQTFAAVTRVTAGMTQVLTTRMEVLAIDPVVGSWWPRIVKGRQPRSDSEITGGRVALRALGVGIGQSVDIGSRRLTVVGEHVVPELSNGDFGYSLAMTSGAAEGLALDLLTPLLLVDRGPAARRAAPDTETALLGGADATILEATPPAGVHNLGQIGDLDELVVASCVALGALAVISALVGAGRSRRRDRAVMVALGSGRRTLVGSTLWEFSIGTGIGGLVGIAAGMLAGRMAWHRTAEDLGVLGDLWRWPLIIVWVAAGLVVVTAVTATVVGGRATRASSLWTE